MVPYKVIRRWAVGTCESRCANERVIEAVYFARVPGLIILMIGISIVFNVVNAFSGPFLCAWFLSLVVPVLTSFFAFKKRFPIPYICSSFAFDWLILAYGITLADFSPLIIVSCIAVGITNANNTGGPIWGFICCIGLTFWCLVCMLGSSLLVHGISVPLPSYVAWIWVIFTGGYVFIQSSGTYRVFRSLKKERKKVQALNQQIKEQVLVRYLPPDLINDIFDGKISMDTKPHSQQITVLFSDLSGFTKMSEQHGAEVVSEFLNDYLTIMNETIFANKGTIDKFIGDAIMVIFGAPVAMSEGDQAKNAARCAIAMQQGMVLVNQKWKSKGIDEVSMRIGVHQGKAVVGNFGSAQRVDYTAIGPSVNLASRIETACTPGEIYVSQEVRELLHDEPATDLAGEFELKGIEGKTSLYKLVDWG